MRHFHDYVGRPSLKRNPSGSSEGGSEGSFYLEREVCFVWLWSKEGLWRLLLWLCFLKKWKGCDELARHQRRRPFGSFVLLSLNQRAFTASLQLRKADEATISQIVYFWKLKCYKCIVNRKKTVISSKTPKLAAMCLLFELKKKPKLVTLKQGFCCDIKTATRLAFFPWIIYFFWDFWRDL